MSDFDGFFCCSFIAVCGCDVVRFKGLGCDAPWHSRAAPVLPRCTPLNCHICVSSSSGRSSGSICASGRSRALALVVRAAVLVGDTVVSAVQAPTGLCPSTCRCTTPHDRVPKPFSPCL